MHVENMKNLIENKSNFKQIYGRYQTKSDFLKYEIPQFTIDYSKTTT